MAAPSEASSYAAGSVASSRSSDSRRARIDRDADDGQERGILEKRSSLENGIFGVLFTLSKENSETRIRIRWVLLKILLDGWQLFATVIQPAKQGWDIDPNGAAWSVVGVLNFTWLTHLGYGAYLALLYAAVALLVVNIGLCVWVAWCFKEQKFPVVWPIKVLRLFSSVFFQAFDVASLNLLQLGISCRFTGPVKPHMYMDLFPVYSCMTTPQVIHAVISGVFLLLFVIIAMLLNMAEVEVNPLGRRPMALGHSGAEVMAFAVKALLTLVDVFLGWRKVAACAYLALSLALAWQNLRWNPNLVAWVNYLKSGVSTLVVWCCLTLMLLVFAPGVKQSELSSWSSAMTITMLAGLAPAFGVGAAMSWFFIRKMTTTALQAMATAKPETPIQDICDNLDDPRDVEIVARCSRVWRDRYTLDPEAVKKAHSLIKAGLAMFPGSAYMVLLHANFMIDVLGVSQSGARRIEDARKLNPGLMCRFMMFVRQQQATQKAAGNSANDGASMDLLSYVEYQRKQRMVVRLHREALQAMCNFWKALDASRVSFTHLSKALGKIESSVSQAQAAYRVVLESYRNSPKLVRLYGKFLEKIKNDPWGAAEYFAEADRLEEVKNGDARGPLLPDGTPLGRMDEMAAAVLVINATGEIQMANKRTHILFGHKRGTLEAKPLAMLLAPHCARRFADELAELVANNGMATSVGGETTAGHAGDSSQSQGPDIAVVGMHYDRVAFPVKLSLRKASGVGEDSTFIALMEPMPPPHNTACLWVSPNGIVAAADPQFVANFGWRATEVNGSNLTALMMVQATDSMSGGSQKGEDEEAGVMMVTESASDTIKRLLTWAKVGSSQQQLSAATSQGLQCLLAHKYNSYPVPCRVTITPSGSTETPVHELRLQLASDDPAKLLVVNRKGVILHASTELASALKDSMTGGGHNKHGHTQLGSAFGEGLLGGGGSGAAGGGGGFVFGADLLTGFTLCEFLPAPWKDMHVRFLKDITSSSPPTRSLWSCRKAAPQPTLELRTMTGRPLYMQVSITSGDLNGESTHVIGLQRSSLENALSERRVRLTVSEDCLISAISQGPAAHMFGMDTNRVVGRGLWEVVDEAAATHDDGRVSTPGPRMLGPLIAKALAAPGQSWRVSVATPTPRRGSVLGPAVVIGASKAKPAIMQVHVEPPSDEEAAAGQGNHVYVDLWPVHAVSGVLQLDATGRITSVLEEHTRPAGLLFGLHHDALVGEALDSLVTMPPGRTSAAELLSLHGAKKSNLKTKQKDVAVKVGPVHKLRATHADGKPLVLDVQVVGKPGPNEPVIAILRLHTAPMAPAATPPPAFSSPPPAQPSAARKPTVESALEATKQVGASKRFATDTEQPPQPSAVEPVSAVVAAPTGDMGKVEPKQSIDSVGTPPEAGSPRRVDSVLLKGQSTGGDQQLSLPQQDPSAIAPASAPQPPPPAALLAALSASGLPTPGVTAAAGAARNTAAEVIGRSKLADLVKSRASSSGGENALLQQPAVAAVAAVPQPPLPGTATAKPGQGGDADLKEMEDFIGAGADGDGDDVAKPREAAALRAKPGSPRPAAGRKAAAARAPAPGTPDDSDEDAGGDPEDGEHQDGSDSEKGARPGKIKGNDRISTWVTSKGAFYQNSVVLGDGKADEDGDNGSMGSSECPEEEDGVGDFAAPAAAAHRASGPGALKGALAAGGAAAAAGKLGGDGGGGGNYADDDAGSEGGQSAISAQSSSGGAEYKRGKRFRKLVKLMDSGQAQQVQQRFRMHALITVALLAIVHVVCFTLTVVNIQAQRNSMLQLGYSGELQTSLHQMLTDVRSLDSISRNKTLENIFTAADAPMFVKRLSRNAEQIKVRLNNIMATQGHKGSKIMDLFYFYDVSVWDGWEADGSSSYINLTVWDFATRTYAMAKNVEQHWQDWLDEGTHVLDTPEAYFLHTSSPLLFQATRKVLDALLFEAVDSVKTVDFYQLAFLAIEGAFISCAAAFYLAYLLRAVAAQRYKLYGTFLVIPVGLTRALASQNTALLVDGEEDEEDDDEEETKPAALVTEDDTSGHGGKQKRRANFASGGGADASGAAAGGTFGKPQGSVAAAAGAGRSASNVKRGSASEVYGGKYGGGQKRGSSGDLGGGAADGKYNQSNGDDWDVDDGGGNSRTTSGAKGPRLGCWAGFKLSMRRMFRRTRGVSPLHRIGSSQRGGAAGGGAVGAAAGGAAPASSKRVLKYDSYDTAVMLIPFVVWSALVITIYAVAVASMSHVVSEVAIHSVVNFMSARTSRAVFYGQEVAAVDDPADLPARQADLLVAIKLVRDAWYTLQLGDQAYRAAGNDTALFPLVTTGLSYRSPKLANLFYGSGSCHRLSPEYLPCPGPEYRFYEISHTGLDSMMQQFMISIHSIATNTSGIPEGMEDDHFDYLYNVGFKDIVDGTMEVKQAHTEILLSLFNNILLLHIILFLFLWVIFAGFLFLMLNPLIKRVSKERRRIAELMSQLPLELDVEKLVGRALALPTTAAGALVGSGGSVTGVGGPFSASGATVDNFDVGGGHGAEGAAGGGGGVDTTSKWKAIIKQASVTTGKGNKGAQ
ncbi:hypothetical protein CHLRE_01g004157v5 [Chlamydomonas reinhardtii]|uniref:TmcB/TmcC TPR repeats domain-containing protein n=1 Tax=Chlamydomonas reinhardtii TaxID=3055 RepID=A0A2K3E4W9_CHLRE|nr:uncharacterized protein CHLRE_01g004157v5 [Chlamydomonas reinhardtii]PNW87845.1 hypothetical protein CHLRE_01g004157v5 [Chlamydomonas reinhardtii]